MTKYYTPEKIKIKPFFQNPVQINGMISRFSAIVICDLMKKLIVVETIPGNTAYSPQPP